MIDSIDRSAPPPTSSVSTNPTRNGGRGVGGSRRIGASMVPRAGVHSWHPLSSRIANISIDFESIYYYSETLGLNHPDRDRDYERIVDRFLELFEELGVAATFFMVGEDIRL